ncbi:MAG: ribosome biogenesis GTPase Der [Archangium sp.]|nr:ribosome biogenesis GTPase Der [Archangium sp.]
MPARRPIIAIVGRPNVGKSTLFNRLIGRKRAIVEDTPGVTRDRHFMDTELEYRPVTVVDTGGFVLDGDEDQLASQIRLQAQAAVEAADVIVLIVDGRVGVTSADRDVASFLRKSNRPKLVVVNKVDTPALRHTAPAEFHSLGLGEPLITSGEHNIGIAELGEEIVKLLPPIAPEDVVVEEEDDEGEGTDEAEAPAADAPIRIAIVGRPNVGKSTLVNALLGEERVIVSPIAGTTRDPIDSALRWKDRDLVLVDTAGIRRKSAVTQRVEAFSVLGALRAVEDSDVTALVLDATEAGVDQDRKIAGLAEEKGRALIIVVNKWDLVRGTAREETFRESLKWYLTFVAWAPMVFISAKEGMKVTKVLELATQLHAQQAFRAPTPRLNRLIEHVTTEHSMPIINGKQLKLYYAMQVGSAPPSFAFICNAPAGVPDQYARYVSNYLRKTFDLKVPLRLFWRERPGKEKRAAQGQRFKNREQSIRDAARRKRKPRPNP